MARVLIFLWLSPVVLFSAWISFSMLDWHFGLPFMTREAHDLVFNAYEAILGIERARIVALIRNALILDAVVLGLIVAWKRRTQIRGLFVPRTTARA